MNDFGYALIALKTGMKVRRAHWPVGKYIRREEMTAAGVEIPALVIHNPKEGLLSYVPNLTDLFATDWSCLA